MENTKQTNQQPMETQQPKDEGFWREVPGHGLCHFRDYEDFKDQIGELRGN